MVIHYPFFGGPHNQALRLAGPLAEAGVETTVLLPDEPGNAAERLRAAGVDVVTAPLHRLRARPDPFLQARFAARFRHEVQAIRRLIRSRRVDLVEVNGLVNPHGAVAGRLEGVPVVWQLLDTRAPNALRRALMPLVRRLADVVMTTGEAVADVHPGARELGDRLIPFFPPVDTELFRPSAEERARARRALGISDGVPVVGTVANLTPQKGLEYFIAAAGAIRAELPTCSVALFGRPMASQVRYEAMLRQAAARAGLLEPGVLTIRDPDDRVSFWLRSLDVFLLTSVVRSEGVSTTVLEAMASGVPVVATDVGALREVVDGGSGVLVEPLDARALAGAALRLLRDDSLRRSVGVRARERVELRYGLDSCALAHLTAFDVACRHARTRRAT
jgi:glycosyltransferase involved in cell wall biosynthesis